MHSTPGRRKSIRRNRLILLCVSRISPECAKFVFFFFFFFTLFVVVVISVANVCTYIIIFANELHRFARSCPRTVAADCSGRSNLIGDPRNIRVSVLASGARPDNNTINANGERSPVIVWNSSPGHVSSSHTYVHTWSCTPRLPVLCARTGFR